ncbi:MAG: hypothetical protein AAB802_03815, partial [Patescibacteria group bacterium]
GRTDFVHVAPENTQFSQNNVSNRIHEAMQIEAEVAVEDNIVSVDMTAQNSTLDKQLENMMGDAPACGTCGHITVRNGSCYKCLNCGTSMGCS